MSKLYEEIYSKIEDSFILDASFQSQLKSSAKAIEKTVINAQIELLHKLEYAVNPSVAIKEFKKDLKKQLEQ